MNIKESKNDIKGLTNIFNEREIKSDLNSEIALNECFGDLQSEISKMDDIGNMETFFNKLDNENVAPVDISSMKLNSRDIDLTGASNNGSGFDSDFTEVDNNKFYFAEEQKNNNSGNFNNSQNHAISHSTYPQSNFNQNTRDGSNYKTKYIYKDPALNTLTEEKIKREHIDQVMTNMMDPEEDFISMEKETEEDNKLILIDEIDLLKEDLKGLGVALKNTKDVNVDSSLEDINNMHKLLLYKYNSVTNWGFVEELVGLGADAVEFVLNGKRDIFGAKPNAKGFKKNTKVHLRQLRFKSAKAVSNTMQTSNWGLFPALAMRLVPGLIAQIKKNSDENDELLEYDTQASMSNIHSMSM